MCKSANLLVALSVLVATTNAIVPRPASDRRLLKKTEAEMASDDWVPAVASDDGSNSCVHAYLSKLSPASREAMHECIAAKSKTDTGMATGSLTARPKEASSKDKSLQKTTLRKSSGSSSDKQAQRKWLIAKRRCLKNPRLCVFVSTLPELSRALNNDALKAIIVQTDTGEPLKFFDTFEGDQNVVRAGVILIVAPNSDLFIQRDQTLSVRGSVVNFGIIQDFEINQNPNIEDGVIELDGNEGPASFTNYNITFITIFNALGRADGSQAKLINYGNMFVGILALDGSPDKVDAVKFDNYNFVEMIQLVLFSATLDNHENGVIQRLSPDFGDEFREFIAEFSMIKNTADLPGKIFVPFVNLESTTVFNSGPFRVLTLDARDTLLINTDTMQFGFGKESDPETLQVSLKDSKTLNKGRMEFAEQPITIGPAVPRSKLTLEGGTFDNSGTIEGDVFIFAECNFPNPGGEIEYINSGTMDILTLRLLREQRLPPNEGNTCFTNERRGKVVLRGLISFEGSSFFTARQIGVNTDIGLQLVNQGKIVLETGNAQNLGRMSNTKTGSFTVKRGKLFTGDNENCFLDSQGRLSVSAPPPSA